MLLVVDVICDSYKNHFWPEIRLDDEITVSELKDKLYIKTGINPSSMNLVAFNNRNPTNKIFLDDENKSISTYAIQTGFTIEVKEAKNPHIVDVSGNPGSGQKNKINMDYSSLANTNSKLYQHYVNQLDKLGEGVDESTFVKYEMSEEDYEKRNTGLRDFMNRMRSKKDSKNRVIDNENKSEVKQNKLMEIKSQFPLESRCCVSPGDRRGTIKYVGYVDNLNIKVGVCLDEPLGDSDGVYNNKRYFSCNLNYGGFFDATHVKIGDYPAVDPFDILN